MKVNSFSMDAVQRYMSWAGGSAPCRQHGQRQALSSFPVACIRTCKSICNMRLTVLYAEVHCRAGIVTSLLGGLVLINITQMY